MATLSELRNLFRFGTDYTSVVPFNGYQTAANQNLLQTTASSAWIDLWNLPGNEGRQHQDFEVVLQGNTAITAGQTNFEGSHDSSGASPLSIEWSSSANPTGISLSAISIVSGQITHFKVSNPLGLRFVRCRISSAFTGAATGVRAVSTNYSPKSLFPQLLRVIPLTLPVLNLAQIGTATITAGAGAVAGGTQRVIVATGSVGATSSIASATSATVLLAASATRIGATVFNESTATLYLLFGAGTVSVTNYTMQVGPGQGYMVPPIFAALKMDGIWSAANGSARITAAT